MDNVSKERENIYRPRKFGLNFLASLAFKVLTIRKNDDISKSNAWSSGLGGWWIYTNSLLRDQKKTKTKQRTIGQWCGLLAHSRYTDLNTYTYLMSFYLISHTIESLFLFDNWPKKVSLCKNKMMLTHHCKGMCLWVFSGLVSNWHFCCSSCSNSPIFTPHKLSGLKLKLLGLRVLSLLSEKECNPLGDTAKYFCL